MPDAPLPPVSCPACAKPLRLSRAAAPGRFVVCPACRHRFCPTRPAALPKPPPPPRATAAPAARPVEMPAASPWSLVAAIAALVALLGGAVAFALLLTGVAPDAPAPVVAVAGAPPPTDPTPRPADPPNEPPPPSLPPPEPSRAPLPAEIQTKVNQAIDRGGAWLRKQQRANGAFDTRHPTALAALPALTLLECGARADDPAVQKAARYVRTHAAGLRNATETYELSLALLFLDRLGEAGDKGLIQLIALRLIAGQQRDGGWAYKCPVLSEGEQAELLTALRLTRLRPYREGAADATRQAGSSEEARRAAAKLPDRLREVPSVIEGLRPEGAKPPAAGRSDNSNTQFATLALWAALRHGVPAERSLELNARRLRHFQAEDGSWKYATTKAAGAPGAPAMTGAGLLGLAVGHGLAHGPGAGKTRIDDPAVTRGLDALARHVGKALSDAPVPPKAKAKAKSKAKGKAKAPAAARGPINLYFLWTVERVGVLYNVPTMGGKDWYRWAVEELLGAQDDDGSWHQRNYYGSTRQVDTCLALLVLKRVDLAADLSGRLEFVLRTPEKK